MADRPAAVHIMEVGPRDGLQIEPIVVPTDAKVDFIADLVAAGLRQIEVGSFVNPKAVPQMADHTHIKVAIGLSCNFGGSCFRGTTTCTCLLLHSCN